MEWIEYLKVIILGIVEGITEWLPISSTGHLILVDEFMKLNMSDAFKDVSTVPTLTLEPFQAEEEKKPAVQPEEPKLDDTILTEEERRMVDAFAQQIIDAM